MLPFMRKSKKKAKTASPKTEDHTQAADNPQAGAKPSPEPGTTSHAELQSKPNPSHTPSEDTDPTAPTQTTEDPQHASPSNKKPSRWFRRLGSSLKKTRLKLGNGLSKLLGGKAKVDSQLLQDLEDILLQADMGVATTQHLLQHAQQRLNKNDQDNSQALLDALKQVMLETLQSCHKPLTFSNPTANSMLMIGVNGAGKTTSIAKLAYYFQQKNNKVMLAAGDTFRAAAVEQLQTWGERQNIPVIAQKTGADSAAVVYDAMQACHARHYDILLADTAGRLHTQQNLLQELAKVKRVMTKVDADAPQATVLVIDATAGQNALVQAEQFHQEIGVDGIILSKLDSSAKGGMVFAIANQLKLPIYFIGVGEAVEDLQEFSPEAFIEALFSE